MKKAKNRKNLITIFSTILGVVFAFITGITYATVSFASNYTTSNQSASAYLGNQQFTVINDTLRRPVAFGDGVNNVEIALQYAVDYDFDVRLRYSLQWSNNSLSTENVILQFVDRDNIIYDENYIYIANYIPKGEGKLNIIAGVDFVNIDDESYFGQCLTINIDSVKIYKASLKNINENVVVDKAGYTATHPLYQDATTSVAAQAWYYLKTNTTNTGKVIAYNTRRNYTNGVSYPGLRTAYNKGIEGTGTNSTVKSAVWIGGNKSYAGVDLYVVAGSESLNFTIEVGGIWRTDTNNTVTDSKLISENSIKLNYTEDWVNKSWDSNKLWETKYFNYTIPANTGCFINVLENIEITSASRVETNKYDSYRAVINSIKLNPNLGDSATIFSYLEGSGSSNKIQIQSVVNNNQATPSNGNYEKSEISVYNRSRYSNGLYEALVGTSASSQNFTTSINLVNNTNATKTIKADFTLKYYISNGITEMTKKIDDTIYRAEELLANSELDPEIQSQEDAFKKSGLNYGFSLDVGSLSSEVVKLEAYSSVNILQAFTASSDLQGIIKTAFGSDYDVWLFVDVKLTNASSTSTALPIESSVSENTLTLSVKNNTNKKVTGVSVRGIAVTDFGDPYYTKVDNEPADWKSSYWKYYYWEDKNSDGKITNNEVGSRVSSPAVGDSFPSNICMKNQIMTIKESLILSDKFKLSDTGISSNTGFVLEPGESAVIGTMVINGSTDISVSGFATATTADTDATIKIINNGQSDAYIMNRSTDSYYVKFSGTLNTTLTKDIDVKTYNSENYYIGIVRPGQIISIPMNVAGDLNIIPVSGDYSNDVLTGWNESAVTLMNNLFNTGKTAGN